MGVDAEIARILNSLDCQIQFYTVSVKAPECMCFVVLQIGFTTKAQFTVQYRNFSKCAFGVPHICQFLEWLALSLKHAGCDAKARLHVMDRSAASWHLLRWLVACQLFLNGPRQ